MNEKENNNKGLSYGKLQEASVSTAVSGEPPSMRVGALAPSAEKAFARSDDRYKTWGEKVHNEITYRGVDFAMNSAFAVAFTFWSARTKAGKKYFTEPVSNFFKKAFKPVFKDPDTPANLGSQFVSIMVGGTVTIPPIMLLENKDIKIDIVKSLDKMHYGEQQVNEDPKFQISYDAIRNEPQKGFWTGMGARFIALAPLFAAHIGAPKFMDKYVYRWLEYGSKGAAEGIGLRPKGLMLEKMADEKGVVTRNWEHLFHVIGFDVSLTFLYSFLHEGAYKWLSSVQGAKNNPTQQNEPRSAAETPVLTQELEEDAASKGMDSQKVHAHRKDYERHNELDEAPSTLIHQENTHHMERLAEGPATAAQM